MELERKKWLLPRTFHRSSFVTRRLAKLLIFHFATRDGPLMKPRGSWPAEVGGP